MSPSAIAGVATATTVAIMLTSLLSAAAPDFWTAG
jgi:hypothetical protein